MKKSGFVITIVIIVAIIMVASAVATYAIWSTMPEAGLLFEMEVVNENPSLKYQLFVPVDAQRKRVAGTFDIAGRNYVLNNAEDEASIVGLGLVGYEGGTVLDRLQIGGAVKYSINGVIGDYDVKCVIVDTDFRSYYLRNNSVIRSLIIQQEVDYIADGAFMSMENLTTLIYEGTGEILVGDDAFSDCPNLTVPHRPDNRTIVGR